MSGQHFECVVVCLYNTHYYQPFAYKSLQFCFKLFSYLFIKLFCFVLFETTKRGLLVTFSLLFYLLFMVPELLKRYLSWVFPAYRPKNQFFNPLREGLGGSEVLIVIVYFRSAQGKGELIKELMKLNYFTKLNTG